MDCGDNDNVAELLSFLSPDLLSKSDFVLLVGSYAEGLANSTSDIDLYAYCETGYQGVLHNAGMMRQRPGQNVEVSVIDRGFFERYLKKANSENYDGFPARDIEIIHKLLKGKVLFGQSAHLTLTSQVQIASFDEKVITYAQDFSISHYDDMIGAHVERDYASAALFSRFLVDSAVDTALAAVGDTYQKYKWRLKRAARALPAAVHDEYLQVTFNATLSSDEAYARHCFQALRLYRRLLWGAWFGHHTHAENAQSSEHKAPQFMTDTWALPYVSHGTRLIKHQLKVYRVELLAQLIVCFAFQPRSYAAIIAMGEKSGHQRRDVIAAMDNLMAMGLLAQITPESDHLGRSSIKDDRTFPMNTGERSIIAPAKKGDAISIILKLVGEVCNLDCSYCYEKRKPYEGARTLDPEDLRHLFITMPETRFAIELHGGRTTSLFQAPLQGNCRATQDPLGQNHPRHDADKRNAAQQGVAVFSNRAFP
ncbi:nucleotidyltransferase domain-containing protein [Pseudomonas sp. NBRC 111124]|uniref:nucleotidyltransferase domain-containing protein n=1 Tax=Pseudomonas sp. NBRC 111124 TaxID=1661039 RepID=UPI0015A73C3F|nr:nucleotidyltransferase domain-containing protein [Pseudomonas sp. NBRC 111124]